jgi:hypothetical protein
VSGSASSTRPQAAAQQRERHTAGGDDPAHRATTKGIDGAANCLSELPVWRDGMDGFSRKFQKSPSTYEKAKNQKKLTGKFSGQSQEQRHGVFPPGHVELQVLLQLGHRNEARWTHSRKLPLTIMKAENRQNVNAPISL